MAAAFPNELQRLITEQGTLNCCQMVRTEQFYITCRPGNFACKPSALGEVFGNSWSFHSLASRAARLMIADCLPRDYNIPRNSFNSLADLQEIWYTWHWWAEAIAHQFWVEYDNSEFSVPSMGMLSDLKLFMSNVSVGHLSCVYRSILHKVTAS